jgi:colanic acid biosynthesis glycosyl transferase WcaI
MSSRPQLSIFGLNYSPEPTGIAPYTTGLAVGLRERGHDVTVHAGHPHYPEWSVRAGYGQWTSFERIQGVRVFRRRHYIPKSPRGIRRIASELTFGARLLFARWERPEIVVAVSPSLFSTALVLARLRFNIRRQPRLVVWVQDIYTLGMAETGEGSATSRRVARWVESSILRAADHVVVIHKRFAEFVVRELGVDETRVCVIRNWTHLPPSEPVDSKQAKELLGWPTNGILAVHTGNMGAKQGLENLVATAQLADRLAAPVHFILVGNGSERRKLEDLANGISRITFVDPLGEEEYHLALNAADLLIVNEKPGVAAMAVPSKLTSYFDAGKPIVAATDPDGITAEEVRAAGAGVAIQAGDPRALLETVLALGHNAHGVTEYGMSARAYRHTVLDAGPALERWNNLLRDIAER